MAGLALGHMALARGTHLLNAMHVSLVAFYLAPVVAAALWYGLRSGVLASAPVTAAFTAHVRLVLPREPLDAAERGALAVFWVVGIVARVLVDQQRAERARARALEQDTERRNTIEALASLAAALGSHDPYTRHHGERVAEVAAAETRRTLTGRAALRGAPPRDCGRDPRPLRGAARMSEIVLSHHKCPDGSGYPRGLRASEIPPEAAVLRVADVYCSLGDARPYKPALPVATALAIMQRMAGPKLDAGDVRRAAIPRRARWVARGWRSRSARDRPRSRAAVRGIRVTRSSRLPASGQRSCHGLERPDPLSKARHGFTVPGKLAIGHVLERQVRHPPECRSLQLGADLLLAVVRSDQK
jgi:hypothetical protein